MDSYLQRKKRGISKLNPFTTYYFKTKYAPLELLKLTKKNLLENIDNTPHQQVVKGFISNHKVTKKDIVTNTMLLLVLQRV